MNHTSSTQSNHWVIPATLEVGTENTKRDKILEAFLLDLQEKANRCDDTVVKNTAFGGLITGFAAALAAGAFDEK